MKPLLLASLLINLSAGIAAAEPIRIPSEPIPTAIGARPAPEPIWGTLTRPAGTAPAPVIILLHGCGGIGKNAWGYAALVLQSFPARHVRTVCAPALQPKVTPLDRAGDAINAALVLQNVPGIDGSRIGVIGFSHGGGTAVTLTRKAFDNFRPGLIKAAVNYYGPCREPQFHGRMPLLSLNGDDDTWGNPAVTCRAFANDMSASQVFETHTYPGVVHGFDNPELVARITNEGHPMQYNAAAAEDSYGRAHAFLDRFVLGKQ
jgi:dienelactone hydrolase